MAAVVCIYRGPAHVLVSVNEAWDSRSWDAPPIGLPACEAWPELPWQPVQRLMDVVYATGIPAAINMPEGLMSISAYRVSGQIAGVGTYYQRTRLAPRLPLLPEDLEAAAR